MLVTPNYVLLNFCFNIIHSHQKKPMNRMLLNLKPGLFKEPEEKVVQSFRNQTEVQSRLDCDDVIKN